MYNSPLDLNFKQVFKLPETSTSNPLLDDETKKAYIEYLKNQATPTNTGDVGDIITRAKGTGGITGVLQGVSEFIASPSGQKILAGLSKNPYTTQAYLGQADTAQNKGDALKAAYISQKDKKMERMGELIAKENEGKQRLEEMKAGKGMDLSNKLAEMEAEQGYQKPFKQAEQDVKEREMKLKENEPIAKAPVTALELGKTEAEIGTKLGLKGEDLANYMASHGQGKVENTFLGNVPLIGGLFKKTKFTTDKNVIEKPKFEVGQTYQKGNEKYKYIGNNKWQKL